MRAVLQRVSQASVEVEGKVVSEIGQGLLCYVGIGSDDTEDDANYIIRKITGVRLWPSEDGAKPWHRSVQGVGGDILCVSQFTLFGRLSGNKPDYSKAMPPTQAKEMYGNFLNLLRNVHSDGKVCDGVFGAMMNVRSVNDGPVTWHIDSRQR